MRKLLLIITTSSVLMLPGCNSGISDHRNSVATINTEVKKTVSLYEESLKSAEALNKHLQPMLESQSLFSDEGYTKLNPHLEGLYNFFNSYALYSNSDSISYEGSTEGEQVENTASEEVSDVALTDYTDVRYYYDDKSNILEQMYITKLPDGNTFLISLEWYKGELIKHEEMVSY